MCLAAVKYDLPAIIRVRHHDLVQRAQLFMENPEVSRTIRKHDARMMEVNPTYSTVLLAGLTEDIADLFHKLNSFACLLQYTRSGRIAVTRSFDEPVSDYVKQNSEG